LSAAPPAQEPLEAVTQGGLELRFGVLLSVAIFEGEANAALAASAPDFSAPITGPAWLSVWLTDIDRELVDSQWRWTAPIDCTGRELCSGHDEINLDQELTRTPL
jgi:hypothetical protein